MIKWLIKWVLRLILLCLVLVVVFLISLNGLVKAALERQIRAETGMEAKIGYLDVGLISPVFTIENFKVYNTAEYGGSAFVEVPELYLEYDRGALVHRKLHVTLMRLNIARVDVVRSDSGKTNIVSALAGVPKGAGARAATWFGGIDVLNLSLGREKLVDLKDPHAAREVNLGISDQVYKNVKTLDSLQDILVKPYLRGLETRE